MGIFELNELPNAYVFYNQHFGKLVGRRGETWVDEHCPFHEDKHKSLSINIVNGAFICHACGESGSSIVDFYMKFYGLTLRQTIEKLGIKLKSDKKYYGSTRICA